MQISGFTMVRGATRLDFPLEASIRSLLPVVDEMVVNVGASDDDTRERVMAIDDPRIRIIDSSWDFSRGPAMLADETQRAMAACRFPWGIYIQADEVLHEAGFPAGVVDDYVARIIAPRLSERLGQNIIVDNRHAVYRFQPLKKVRQCRQNSLINGSSFWRQSIPKHRLKGMDAPVDSFDAPDNLLFVRELPANNRKWRTFPPIGMKLG